MERGFDMEENEVQNMPIENKLFGKTFWKGFTYNRTLYETGANQRT